jgi:hypothetical protein
MKSRMIGELDKKETRRRHALTEEILDYTGVRLEKVMSVSPLGKVKMYTLRCSKIVKVTTMLNDSCAQTSDFCLQTVKQEFGTAGGLRNLCCVLLDSELTFFAEAWLTLRCYAQSKQQTLVRIKFSSCSWSTCKWYVNQCVVRV